MSIIKASDIGYLKLTRPIESYVNVEDELKEYLININSTELIIHHKRGNKSRKKSSKKASNKSSKKASKKSSKMT